MILTSLILTNLLYYGNYRDHDDYFWSNLVKIINSDARYPFLSLSKIYMYHYMDWILMYGLLVLSSWDSLFSWYRYYTTRYISQTFQQPPTGWIAKYFMLYLIPYSATFVIQIHFYYWLFPLVILTHLIFNVYFTWQFAEILLDSYKQSTGYS